MLRRVKLHTFVFKILSLSDVQKAYKGWSKIFPNRFHGLVTSLYCIIVYLIPFIINSIGPCHNNVPCTISNLCHEFEIIIRSTLKKRFGLSR